MADLSSLTNDELEQIAQAHREAIADQQARLLAIVAEQERRAASAAAAAKVASLSEAERVALKLALAGVQ
jgi:hypothetical protein